MLLSRDSSLGDATQATALVLALERRETGIASLLLDKGADVLKADSEGTLPLHMAAAACGIAMVERILKKMQQARKVVRMLLLT